MELAPVEVVTTDIVTTLNIDVIRLEIFKCATLSVSVITSTGKLLHRQCLDLAGDDYKNWANDDNYLYTYVASKLGYTLQPKTVVPDPVVVADPPTDPVVVTDPPTDPVVVTDPPTDPVFFTDPIL